MSQSNQATIARINALLALACDNGASSEEARTAAHCAVKMIRANALTVGDVSPASDKIADALRAELATARCVMKAMALGAQVDAGIIRDETALRVAAEDLAGGLRRHTDGLQNELGRLRVVVDELRVTERLAVVQCDEWESRYQDAHSERTRLLFERDTARAELERLRASVVKPASIPPAPASGAQVASKPTGGKRSGKRGSYRGRPPVQMSARFAGTCVCCGGAIQQGAPMVYDGKAAHVGCHEARELRASSAA